MVTQAPVKDAALQAAIDQAKQNGCRVVRSTVEGQSYVYRSLNRAEWKKLQKLAFAASEEVDGSISATKAMQYREDSEDELVKLAIMSPSTDNLQGWPAGNVPRLVELITKLSGFDEVEIVTEEL